MRKLSYCVAASLDGFIAGPNGEFDWIIMDPSIDFAALFERFDTYLMGRRTFEMVQSQGSENPVQGVRTVVVSTTLDAAQYPDVEIISDNVEAKVAELKNGDGKDIWLFGGGILFGSLLDADLVDTIEIAIIPVLLGDGIRVLGDSHGAALKLVEKREYPSGILTTVYVPADSKPE